MQASCNTSQSRTLIPLPWLFTCVTEVMACSRAVSAFVFLAKVSGPRARTPQPHGRVRGEAGTWLGHFLGCLRLIILGLITTNWCRLPEGLALWRIPHRYYWGAKGSILPSLAENPSICFSQLPGVFYFFHGAHEILPYK